MGTFTKPQCKAHSTLTPCIGTGLSQIVGLPPTPCTTVALKVDFWEITILWLRRACTKREKENGERKL